MLTISNQIFVKKLLAGFSKNKKKKTKRQVHIFEVENKCKKGRTDKILYLGNIIYKLLKLL